MQADVTISVIDSILRFPQCAGMLTADEIREELIRQLEADKVQAADIARALCIAPARVTEMKKRDRRVQQNEMQKLAELLGMVEPLPENFQPVLETHKIRNLGKVAQGLWLEEAHTLPDEPEFIEYDRMSGDPGAHDLFAVTPEGLSMNLEFQPGTRLICRYTVFEHGYLMNEDRVIVERANHDLRELTCKIIRFDNEGVAWLHSNSDQPQFQEPWRLGKPDNGLHIDNEIRVVGRVIRAVRVYRGG